MNLRIQRIIFAVLSIATCIMIFTFSSQNGEVSGSTSRGFTRKIVEVLQIGKNLGENEKEELIENSQYVIRKLAHFSIYTVLGINMYGFVNTLKINNKRKILIVLFVGLTYAISDEIHQMFSGSRTPAIKDVIIDSFGVLFGIGIFKLLPFIFKHF